MLFCPPSFCFYCPLQCAICCHCPDDQLDFSSVKVLFIFCLHLRPNIFFLARAKTYLADSANSTINSVKMGAKHSKKVSEPPVRRASGPALAVLDNYTEDSEGISTRNINDTPNTEVSPPESPSSKSATLIDPNDKRANARTLAASLSLEEQVSLVPIDH